MPTAAGIDYPDAAARNGIAWFKKLGAQADAALAVDAKSANDPAVVARIDTATMIYLPGGDPVFLVNALRGSKSWEAIVKAQFNGVVLGGASAGAMAMGLKMWNPHSGKLIDGLGLVPIVTLPHFRSESNERAKALRQELAPSIRLFGIAERTSAIFNGLNWVVWGPGEVVEFTPDGARTYQTSEAIG